MPAGGFWLTPGQEQQVFAEIRARAERMQMWRDRATPELAQRVADIASAYPFLKPGVVHGAAQAGYLPNDPAFEGIAQAANAMHNTRPGLRSHEIGEVVAPREIEDEDGWWDDVKEFGRGVTRGAFMALEGAGEELRNAITAVGVGALDPNQSVGDAWERRGVSPIRLVARRVRDQADKGWNIFDDGGLEDSAFGGIDVGSGYLTGGAIGRTRDELRERLYIGGDRERLLKGDQKVGASVGRVGASAIARLLPLEVFEPGTYSYHLLSGMLDAAATIFLDPAAWATGGASKVSAAGRIFDEVPRFFPNFQRFARAVGADGDDVNRLVNLAVGRVPGVRKTIDLAGLDNFKASKPYQMLIDDLAQEDSIRMVRAKLRGQGDAGLWYEIRNHDDPNEIRRILDEKLGHDIRRVPVANSYLGSRAVRAAGFRNTEVGLYGGGVLATRTGKTLNWRIAGGTPGGWLNYRDPTQGFETLEALARTVKLPEDETERLLNKWAGGVKEGDGAAALNVFKDFARATVRHVADRETFATKTKIARKANVEKVDRHLSEVFTAWRERDVAYFMAQGKHVAVQGARKKIHLDGKEEAIPRQQLLTEQLDEGIPVFGARDFRREISFLNRAFDIPGVKPGIDGLSHMTSNLIKPLQLIRVAYTVRVLAEEQARMAGAGYASLLNHPMSYIAYTLGQGKLGRKIREKVVKQIANGDVDVDVLGHNWRDINEFARAQNARRGRPEFMDGLLSTENWDWFDMADPTLPTTVKSMRVAREFAQLWNDEIARRFANNGLRPGDTFPAGMQAATPEDAIELWLRHGNGRTYLEQSAKSRPEILTDHGEFRQWLMDYKGRVHEKAGGKVTYGPDNRVLNVDSPGDNDFLAMIANRELATGKGQFDLFDVPLDGRSKASKELMRFIGDKLNQGIHASGYKYERMLDPQRLPGRGSGADWRAAYDRSVGFLFGWVAGKPTSFASRSPVFRQAYWREMRRLMNYATQEVQDAILAGARNAGLDGRVLNDKQLISEMDGIRKSSTTGTQLQTLEEADQLAKALALDEVKGLLYDLSTRGQLGDISRITVPYMDAWLEIGKTWGRIARQNPKVVYRGMRGIDALRGSDTDPDTGTFWTDPATGEELFSYPIVGEMLSEWMFGEGDEARVKLAGRAGGLNLFTQSILPGLGTAITLPASFVLGNSPDTEWLEKWVFPFGEPDVSSGYLESAFPAWFKKALRGFKADESDRIYANSMWDVARGLVRSGEYTMSTPEDVQRTLEAARSKARPLWLVRALLQFAGPTGPSFAFTYTDLEGEHWPYKLLADEYRRLTQESGSQTYAAQVMVDRFGPDFGVLAQGKTFQVRPDPVNIEGARWQKANPDLFREFPDVAGLFAPQAEPGVRDFDYAAYVRQLDDGARTTLTPRQMALLSNAFLGRLAYDNAKRVIEQMPKRLQAEARSQARALIERQYPGFGQNVGVPDRLDAVDAVEQARLAIRHPAIRDTEAGRATAEYLAIRDEALQMLPGLPGAPRTLKSNPAEPIARYLRAEAARIIQKYDEFQVPFERIFDRELWDEPDPLESLTPTLEA